MAASGLRIRLLEPEVGVVTGGSTLLIHGRGFRPPPHSLLVRFRLLDADDTSASAVKIDVSGKFLLESQLEVVTPSFENEVKLIVASRTNLAQSSVTITSAPQIVRVAVEVILDAMQTSNALEYFVHQSLSIRKISPSHVLMAPPTTITLALNILKLPSHLAVSSKSREQPLADITSLPVFVRVKHKAERTGIISQQTRPGRWNISPQGVFEIEFDAVMLGFGVASVEVTLNRIQFFRGVEKLPESLVYQVHRDALLESVDPCTINVTSGRATDIRIFGTGFVDTGDLVVALVQRDLASVETIGADSGALSSRESSVTVAQLSATFVSNKEIQCSMQANMPFGLTTLRVSPNGGKQFGNTNVVALLYRHRSLEEVIPASGSLIGNTLIRIRYPNLPLEGVDAMSLVHRLVPPRRVRIRFQAFHEDGSPIDGLCKIVNVDSIVPLEGPDSNSSDSSAIVCRTPSFLDELKTLQNDGRKVRFDHDGDTPLRVKHFNVSVALGSDTFTGTLAFAYYFPPAIRSITRHHGPATGGTSIIIRMKYKVPCRLSLLVRFLSLCSGASQVVSAKRFAECSKTPESAHASLFSIDSSSSYDMRDDDDPDCLICCETPPWTVTEDLPHLTKIQVSYDGGTEFFPLDIPEPQVMSSRTTKKTAVPAIAQAVTRDWSYLYFLFYKVPLFNAVLPMSADIQGGSSIRIMGDHIIDHGGQITVVFHSPRMSRKVLGFVEKGEVRCCAPPFDVGPVTLYVSLNSEQYTQCNFKDPETTRGIDFVFYSSPSIQSISPKCASVSKPSEIHIFGMNLIETGRIKVRIGFTTPHGKFVHKDVPGKARDGVITATSPTFSSEFANTTAIVDVALNGNDFTGTTARLHYFSSHQIQRVEPRVGAAEISIPVSIQITPLIVTDQIVVCIRLKSRNSAKETTFGPIEGAKWMSDRLAFSLPALAAYVETADALLNVFVDVSFDNVSYHTIGDLLNHYKVYNIPHLTSMLPLYGHFDHETEVTSRGACLQLGDTVKISLFLQNSLSELVSSIPPSRTQIPVAVIVGETNVKRQTLTWKCPRLAHICASTWTGIRVTERMILDEFLTMQISVVDGQTMTLPFKFRYYRTPTLMAMDPSIGYTCSGSVISFEFKEPIETPTVDFRFGLSEPSGGRLRDRRFVECFSPEVEKGVHEISVSFNEQHFEVLRVATTTSDEAKEQENPDAEDEATTDVPSNVLVDMAPVTTTETSVVVTFEAFPLPIFMVPRNTDRICGFGPITGGTIMLIKGLGFVLGTRIYVRFCSPYRDGLGEGTSDVVVKAGVVDAQTIQCTTPPSLRTGRVGLHVSYNLQQFIDSTCFFEYHRVTIFEGRGALCGPVSGKTPVSLVVQSEDGLPTNKTLVECSIRFAGGSGEHFVDVPATFDPESLEITCITPAWPANELVHLWITMSHGPFERFADSRVQYLFYDPPEGVIRIEPPAGPISGGTHVLAWCGKLVDTGEITICITLGSLPSPNTGVETLTQDSKADGMGSGQPNATILVKGTIIGDAVSFVTPSVEVACVAFLNISLNGINYTAIQQSQSLKYVYYVNPVIRRVFPAWCSAEAPSEVRVSGDNICDYGCKVLVRFVRQPTSDTADNFSEPEIVDGQLIRDPSGASSSLHIRAAFPAIGAGFYEVEVSLNGQQFSDSHYMSASYGNFSGTACTSLLPFRVFAAPFFLATSTGPAAGGSTVTLFLSKKLLKLLAKETKCTIQFSPLRPSGDTPLPVGLSANAKSTSTSGVQDPVTVQADIDQPNSRATCRAPLLRVACVAAVDVLLSAPSDTKTSVSQMFNMKEKEKYYSYESPTITDIFPSCGPVSGSTQLVIEAANVVDTGQIFVRFRSTTNERECAIIPGVYSRRFPDGSLSSSPLILCQTPEVEFVDKVAIDPVATASGDGVNSISTNALSSVVTQMKRRSKDVTFGKARVQMFQTMAEQSVNARLMSIKDGGAKLKAANTLRLTRTQPKSVGSSSATATCTIDLALGATVLVDFTLNAGEQFIAHSVKFHYYGDLNSAEIKWSPRHFPTKSLSRSSAQARMLAVQLPKTFRVTDFPDRICFRFDGDSQPVLTKRRGSSIVLHETSVTRELITLDAPRLRSQATSRRRSTISRNTSISMSSTSLLSISNSSNASLSAPIPPSRPRSKQTDVSQSAVLRTGVAYSTAPFIAANVNGLSEIMCPVPDFSMTGPVKVFMSLNAQQFVSLGEIHFHNPIAIAEEDQFRFCSSVGGNRFTIRSSMSSVLEFVAPEDVSNEVNQSKGGFDHVLMKPSKTLDISRLKIADVVAGERDIEQRDNPGSAKDMTDIHWRKRVFCSFHVVLVPHNAAVLSKVTLKAAHPDSMDEMGRQTPDSNGCCVFEVTDWVGDMALCAEVSPDDGYFPYSCIARGNTSHQSEWSSESSRTPIVLMQRPTLGRIAVVLFASNGTRLSQLCLRTNDSKALLPNEVPALPDITSMRDGTIQYTEIATDALLRTGVTECYVCAEYSIIPTHLVCANERQLPKHESRLALTHILIGDRDGIEIGLFSETRDNGVWRVARIQVGDDASSVPRAAIVDCIQDPEGAVETLELSQPNDIAISPRRGSVQPPIGFPTIPVQIHFTPADSSILLSAVASAKLILGGENTVAFLKEPSPTSEIKIECSMPPLTFSGPTNVMVSFGGVMFSNLVCIHCYDPRTWHIVSVEPPCGLTKKPVAIRIKGENFVETSKISVRFADEQRYFTVSGGLARSHLLILRIAAVKHVRALLAALAVSPVSMPKRDDDKTTSGAMDIAAQLPSSFTLTVRVECDKHKVFASCRENTVLAAMASASSLCWEEQFEIQVASKHLSLLVISIDLSDTSLPKPIELARGVLQLNALQEGTQRRKSVRLERHFHRGLLPGTEPTPSSSNLLSEIDLVLHLSPLILEPEYIVCNVNGFRRPEMLCVQVSPGEHLFPPLPAIAPHNSFQVYEPPVVANTSPKVLPRSIGGEILINGSGFIDVNNSGRVCVRLFCCLKKQFDTDDEERRVLCGINQVSRLQQIGEGNFFVRDIEGIVKSSSAITCIIPPSLASYNVFYRLSFDGREFTEASASAHLLLFSVHSIDPKGGPISGNTYAALNGVNINACFSSTNPTSTLSPFVRLSWMRGARELESVIVAGEFYAPDDTIYFYTPQSRFGLHNISVIVELALVISPVATERAKTAAASDEGDAREPIATAPRFTRDEVSFIMYKIPAIRSVAPATALMPGSSSLELTIQGFDEKTTRNMKPAFKVRFKQRGQMQVADVHVASEVRFDCIVPRFNATRAFATEIPSAAVTSPNKKGAPISPRNKGKGIFPTGCPYGGNARCLRAPMKIWTRTYGVFVVLLGARNLRVSKKHTCNPFAILSSEKGQQKSTRKDATFSPVWNEVFDFEWPASRPLNSPTTSLRIVIENQLTLDQSEFIGQIELAVDDRILKSPLSFRGWLPLRPLRGERKELATHDTRQLDNNRRTENTVARLGEVEVAFAFIPPPAVIRPRDRPKSLANPSLRASILSVVSSHTTTRNGEGSNARVAETAALSRKEHLLRAFKQKGPPMSMIPTEIQIELALNGQDFWSVSPVRCYTLPPPILFAVEPAFISIAGGTVTSISGLNFVNSGSIRVAFIADAAPSLHSPHEEGKKELHRVAERVVVVDAKYRSSTNLVCISPPLLFSDGIAVTSVKIYVCLNGVDFDSIALPRQLVKLHNEGEVGHSANSRAEDAIKNSPGQHNTTQRIPGNQAKVSSISIAQENGQYVITNNVAGTDPQQQYRPLDCRVHVYHVPKITCVRPTDGIYTSLLTFDGSNFTDTGIAIARFTSTSDEKDVRTSRLEVQSLTQMECRVPDFPRGIVVRIEVSMNGVEFIPYDQELRLFQLPRLSEIVPSWISSGANLSLQLRGINLAAAAIATSPNDLPTVHVSMSRGPLSKFVSATCEDGEAQCSIPRELLAGDLETSKGSSAKASTNSAPQELVVEPPIEVDIRLGGANKELTGKPLLLRIYRRIPIVTSVSPMDGPVYGGVSIVVEGKGFVDTGSIIVRFQFFPLRSCDTDAACTGSSKDSANQSTTTATTDARHTTIDTGAPSDKRSETVAFVDAPAKFISRDRILCPAPVFPQEGVYVVLVALNGMEFTAVNDATWFLAWQNWQKRKQLLLHDLFAAPRLARDIAVAVASPRDPNSLTSVTTTVVGMLEESEVERLRRKTAFMLPQIKGAGRSLHPESGSLARAPEFNPLQEDELEEDLAELTNPKLLHWHPSSAADEKGQPLQTLLITLCNSRESQKIICRRLRIVFRMKGIPCRAPSESAGEEDEIDHHRLDLEGRNRLHVSAFEIAYPAFVQGMRLIFPHALDRDLESLWSACGGTENSRLTYESLLAKVMRPVSVRRCGSPEPGPTHYNPQFDIVSPRVPAAVVLPQAPEPEVITGLPSELFINYETAYKAVKPTAPGAVFRKRKFNTSWCNPVPPEEAVAIRVGGKSPDTAAVATTAEGSAPSTSAPTKTPRAPLLPSNRSFSSETAAQSVPEASKPAAVMAGVPASGIAHSKESSPRVPGQVSINRESQARKAVSSNHSVDAGGYQAISPSTALQSGSNLFYNDIAPMYQKFLRSKEIQKLMRLAGEDSDSVNHPPARNSIVSRDKR